MSKIILKIGFSIFLLFTIPKIVLAQGVACVINENCSPPQVCMSVTGYSSKICVFIDVATTPPTTYQGCSNDTDCASGLFCLNLPNTPPASKVCVTNAGIIGEGTTSQSTSNDAATTNTALPSAATEKNYAPLEPKLQIPIPNLTFTKLLPPVDENGQSVLYIPYIAEYLAGLYKYLISIMGIFAGVMITYAGIKWMLAGGSPDKISEAKKKIGDAIIGLILAVGSYTILYLVNPDLVTFKALRVPVVQTILFDMDPGGAACTPRVDPNGKTDLDIVNISGNENIIASNKTTTKINYNKLVEAAKKLKADTGLKIQVNSGGRNIAFQASMVQKRCKWNPSNNNYESCSVATLSKSEWWTPTGQFKPEFATKCLHENSLDLQTSGASTKDNKVCPKCGSITSAKGRLCWARSPCQQELIKKMVGEGFSVMLKPNPCASDFEPWHFNFSPPPLQGGTTKKMDEVYTALERARLAVCP